MSGRGQFPQRGRSTNRGNSGGDPRRYDRDEWRAYKYQQRQVDWADSTDYVPPPPPAERRSEYQRGRNQQRASNWKQRKEKKEKPPPVAAPTPTPATVEDAPKDAPLYDSTPFTSGVHPKPGVLSKF